MVIYNFNCWIKHKQLTMFFLVNPNKILLHITMNSCVSVKVITLYISYIS